MTRAPSGRAKRGFPSAVAPIDAAAFAESMAGFSLESRSLAVAVSGGADSMALVLLLREWCAHRHMMLTALTVDHCLRDESSAEAAQVGAWCKTLDVAHVVLPWRAGASQRGLARSPQTAARAARYDLLLGWCSANGNAPLCIAHHADDQIETFFLRL